MCAHDSRTVDDGRPSCKRKGEGGRWLVGSGGGASQPASELPAPGFHVHDGGKAAQRSAAQRNAAQRVVSRRVASFSPFLTWAACGGDFRGDEIPASNCCANNVAQTQPRRRGDRQRARKRPITRRFPFPPSTPSLSRHLARLSLPA